MNASNHIGKIIIEMSENCLGANPERKGDYRNADGLLTCGVCGCPKQTVVEFLPNMPITVPCACACTEREYQQKERERDRRRIERAREAIFGGTPHLTEYTFENDDGSNPALSSLLQKYVERFEEIKRSVRAKGLLLWGDCGRGKTFGGCEVINALHDGGVRCRFVRASEAIFAASDYKNGADYLKDLCRTDVLMLDEFGTSTDPRSIDKLGELLDLCVKNDVTLIVTTNLSIEEIKNPPNLSFKRLYDRLIELCAPFEVKGKDHRRADATDSYKTMKEMLEL